MRVLISGAGPTGCALAYLLARRGLDVVLLERETTFDRVFRGEALMPSGVDAIAQMGLQEPFRQLPQRQVECMELFVEGDRGSVRTGRRYKGRTRRASCHSLLFWRC
jgi:2-polyprenyl-6-methoxyphenol hydroxylase-like FAD-dependent oxidoreductase